MKAQTALTLTMLISIAILNYALSPVNAATETLYQMPILIESFSSSQSAESLIGYAFQSKAFYANGRYWIFYDSLKFESTTMLDRWTDPPTTITTFSSANKFSVVFDGAYVHYVRINASATPTAYYRRGVPNADGTITWDPEQLVGVLDYPSIAVDSNGYVWIGGINNSKPVVLKNLYNNGTWQKAFTSYLSTTTNSYWRVAFAPLTSGKMYVVYTARNIKVYGRLYDQGWGSQEEISQYNIIYEYTFSVKSYGDTVHLAYTSTSPYHIYYDKRTYSQGWMENDAFIESVYISTTPVLAVQGETVYIFWIYDENVYFKNWKENNWSATKLFIKFSVLIYGAFVTSFTCPGIVFASPTKLYAVVLPFPNNYLLQFNLPILENGQAYTNTVNLTLISQSRTINTYINSSNKPTFVAATPVTIIYSDEQTGIVRQYFTVNNELKINDNAYFTPILPSISVSQIYTFQLDAPALNMYLEFETYVNDTLRYKVVTRTPVTGYFSGVFEIGRLYIINLVDKNGNKIKLMEWFSGYEKTVVLNVPVTLKPFFSLAAGKIFFNADRVNDTIILSYNDTEMGTLDVTVKVYNIYGGLVFNTTEYGNFWTVIVPNVNASQGYYVEVKAAHEIYGNNSVYVRRALPPLRTDNTALWDLSWLGNWRFPADQILPVAMVLIVAGLFGAAENRWGIIIVVCFAGFLTVLGWLRVEMTIIIVCFCLALLYALGKRVISY
ncbi:MAG: hypothetical protein QXH20_05090 [Candidatus Bathyarchaeia archaeon]